MIPSKFQFWHFRLLWWNFAKFLMSFSEKQVSFSLNFASLFNVIIDNSSNSLVQTIYTLLKRSPLKRKFLRISSAQVKFCQIPYVNLEATRWFLSKFCIHLHFMKDNSSVLFFISNNIYFAQKKPIKVELFETFECSHQNLSNSLCQSWNNKSIPLQI